MIESFLKNNNFNDKDIQIYLDIFRHGQSFASSVATRTEIDRTTVYSALKRLLKQGIIVQTKLNDVRAYMAVSPEIFVDRVDRRMDELKAERNMALIFAKEIQKISKSDFLAPKIRIFEGVDAIKNLYEQTLEKSGQQKSFLTLDYIPQSLRQFLTVQFIESKKKKKVFSKVLVANNSKSKRYGELDRESNRESRVVKSHPFNLHSEIILFAGKQVAIIDFHKQIYGMVIDSETFYKTMEAMFDFIWDMA